MRSGSLAILVTVAFLALGMADAKAKTKAKGDGWEESTNEDGRVVQQLKIQAPTMTEEDQYGYVMPDRYRCDACKAVMFHLDAGLRQKQPKNRRLKAWEYMDVLDETCRAGFDGYGVKLVNGENMLSGPGLKQSDDIAPGEGAIQMGGETWGKRLGEICRKIVFEKLGEDEIYDKFYSKFRASDSANSEGLSEALCASTEVRDCSAALKTPVARTSGGPKKAEKKAKKNREHMQDESQRTARKSKSQASSGVSAEARDAASEGTVDAMTFLRELAGKHGVSPNDYTKPRTARDWEKLMVAVSGKIFNSLSEVTV